MEQDSTTKCIKDLSESCIAVREFSTCLDAKFRCIYNWEEFAFSLEVPPDVIRACKIYFEYSPTLRIFEYLKINRPGMTVDDLKDVFTRNKRRARHDIKKMLDDCKELKGDSKIADVITNSTTSSLLDQIAVKLDSATRTVCNWLDFGLELDIQQDILQRFEMYVNYNPTENLFRLVYTTSKESLKLGTLLGFLECMERHDILDIEDIKAQSKQVDVKNVFKLDSKLLDETSQLLNRDTMGAQGWRRLAELFVEYKYIDIPNIISCLEPPRQHEMHSPTTKTIEWLAANKPELTIGNLIEACETIKRKDAMDILLKHFPTCCPSVPVEQDINASQLRYSIQETPEQTEHILQGNTRSLGLPESTPEIVGREKEIKSLVSELSSGHHQLIVLHGPTGIGKETISVAATKELTKSDHIVINVSSDGILSVDDLAVKILTTCGFPDPVSKQHEKVKALFKEVGRKNKCVIVLQNFDHMFHSSSDKVPETVGASESASMDISISSQTNDCDDNMTFTSQLTASRLSTRISDPFHSSSCNPSNNTHNFSRQDILPRTIRSLKEIVSEKLNYLLGHDQIRSSSTYVDDVHCQIPLSSTQAITISWTQANKDIMEKEKYHTFLEELLLSAPNLKILITTWESFASTRVKTKQVELEPLSLKDSKTFLINNCKNDKEIDLPSSISKEKLNHVLEFCSGIPQLLQNAVVVFDNLGASAGADLVASCPLRHKLQVFCPNQLGIKNRVNYCLQRCFGRLDKSQQNVLVMVTVFPGSFTVEDVVEIFQELEVIKLRCIVNELKNFSFLLHCKDDDSYRQTLAVKSFAVNIATSNPPSPYSSDDQTGSPFQEPELNRTYRSALLRFALYTFNKIEEVEDKFYSMNSKEAIQLYKQQVKNLKEIVNWCISGRLSSDNELERVKHTIIHSFVQCYIINVKLIKSHFLKTIIRKLAQTCQNSTSYSKKLFIDCLICGGVTFVLSCLCVPPLCVNAQDDALKYFGKAIQAAYDSSWYSKFPSLKDQLEIICRCDTMSERARTQFLVKYGKCLVRQGRKLGLAYIRRGINLRKEKAKKSLSVRDKVMVAAGYNDLASAYSYIGYYNTAIYKRGNRVLPVYQMLLGIHPFTASAQSHLAHDLLAVGRIEEALNACKIALEYRQSLLGIHSETARSLFDMGRIIREQACGYEDQEEKKSRFETALEYLNKSLEMSRFLGNLPQETANTHQEIADVLIRLGRDEEASVQYAEIPDLLKSINSSHIN